MNGKKGLLLGLSLGLCLGTALPAFGQPVSEPIQAYLNHSYYFTFDGERTELPEDGHVLVYEGRSYVPARFVAEQLGATVTWHSDTKEIEIRREKQVDSDDTTGNQTSGKPGSDSTKETYKRLPQKIRTENYTAEAFLHVSDNNGQRLWLRIENTSDSDLRLQLNQSKTVFLTPDGRSYEMNLNEASDFDKRWYSEIIPEETKEGYLLLPSRMDSRLQQWTVVCQLQLIDRRGMQTTEEVRFAIDLGK